jgi:leukotriene-A4 hydrolase
VPQAESGGEPWRRSGNFGKGTRVAHRDPHSWCDSDQPEAESLELRLRIDFESRSLAGEVLLRLRAGSLAPEGGPLDLDTRELSIEAVSSASGAPLAFALGEPDPILGSRLRIELPPGVDLVHVRYRTSSRASCTARWPSIPRSARALAPPSNAIGTPTTRSPVLWWTSCCARPRHRAYERR